MEHSPFFFADIDGDRAVLQGSDAHHLSVVRRAQPGDTLTVSDGAGSVYRAEVSRVSGSRVELNLSEPSFTPRPKPGLCLIQAIAKSDKTALVVEKMVEVGVAEILLFYAERSVPRWEGSKAQRLAERFEAISFEAAKQSRNPWLPAIEALVGIDAAEARAAASELALVCYENAERPLREALPPNVPEEVSLIVGPEGGLSDREVERFRQAGAAPVSLGPQILRTETAGLVAATAVLFRYGRIG